MNASAIFFYVIAAFILAMGFLAVTSRKIFRSAIWLLFSLVGIAGLFFWMQLEFLAAVQIVVYAGGIVVLIIFSIFLTQKAGGELPRTIGRRRIFSLLAVIIGFVLTAYLIGNHEFKATGNGKLNATVSEIGSKMLSTGDPGYALPFEVVSILLLAAMVGCIVIAMKGPSELKPKDQTSKTKRVQPSTIAP